MILSDKLSELDQRLQDSGDPGQVLRFSLLHHLGELIRDLTCNVEASAPVPVDAASRTGPPGEISDEVDPVVVSPPVGTIALPEYGDEAMLHHVRMEALEVFETRRFCGETYIALWLDVVRVWQRSLLLCMGVTTSGYRHILGFVEALPQQGSAMRPLVQDLLNRGLCPDQGLLCITPGSKGIAKVLSECFGTQLCLQSCQAHILERVVSPLCEADQRRLQGEFRRAFSLPDAEQAHAALLQIHRGLTKLNRSAATWLLQELDPLLTLQRTGLYDQLSPSLRSTRCIHSAAQHLRTRLRGVRQWLPPQSQRAQFALVWLEMEQRMRRIAHASVLASLQSTLFPNESSPS